MNVDQMHSWIHVALALAVAPLLSGIINRIKALIAGRRGQPLLQLYFDLWRLLRKGAVYSTSTTWVFRVFPVLGLSCLIVAVLVVPFGGTPAPISFGGDIFLFIYVLALARFSMVLAALDTASSFEGMGGSREVFFSALAEPALMLSMAAVSRMSHSLSLSGMFVRTASVSAEQLIVAASMAIVYLCENARVPFDDPNTHLELTMIHEVMVLDHSGPDLAMIQYMSALKLWVLGSLLTGLLIPPGLISSRIAGVAIGIIAMGGLAATVGLIESVMARARLVRVPGFLLAATALAGFALVLVSG